MRSPRFTENDKQIIIKKSPAFPRICYGRSVHERVRVRVIIPAEHRAQLHTLPRRRERPSSECPACTYGAFLEPTSPGRRTMRYLHTAGRDGPTLIKGGVVVVVVGGVGAQRPKRKKKRNYYYYYLFFAFFLVPNDDDETTS